MTSLGYLLPFLWALALGQIVTDKPTTVATPPRATNQVTTIVNPARTTVNPAGTAVNPAGTAVNPAGTAVNPAVTAVNPAVTAVNPAVTAVNPAVTAVNPAKTTVNPAKTTVNPTNPAVPPSAASTNAAVSSVITKLTSVSAGTATVNSGPQAAVLATTVKTDTKSVGVTNSEPRLSTINVNTPSVKGHEGNSIQPTKLAEASATVLNDSSVLVTSHPNFIKNEENVTSKLAATSRPFSGTSKQSDGISVTNNYIEVGIPSTEVPSGVAKYSMSTTAAGSISDFTTSLQKKTIPSIIPSVNYKQENIEFNCKEAHEGSLMKINIEPSKICGHDANENDAKEILKHICTTIKPGYQPNKDKCHIDLGSGSSSHLVVVNAYVQSSLSPDELYASLKHIKKDSSYLFQYENRKFEEEDLVSIPLISAIVSLAVALLIIAAIYGCWHQRQTRKREQRLTEELQTMENGYHDNPTLEVMETSPEMQEKKGGPNGELGDSWIVPLDNLTREDLDDEEDTHL
ncbi:podocalyxin [Bufo gargarizans]|uniref:podocalyxin n=1 Tax=Bufo gargarizans TaxID=30331 RepID=UPI001CF4BA9A|nr:podocalyxin [Bufo gargarizans]